MTENHFEFLVSTRQFEGKPISVSVEHLVIYLWSFRVNIFYDSYIYFIW